VKVGLACGGTGGHFYPGLATAEVLRRRGHDVTLWLAGKSVESRAGEVWKGPSITVRAEGLPSGLAPRSLVSAWRLMGAVIQCRRRMRADRPDVVLGMGSYGSVGPVAAALLLRIPVVLHESNVLPGRAVALLSWWARAVAGCFEETRYYLRRRNLVLTGMPLRQELEDLAAKAARGRLRAPLTILVMGGSQGAHALNMLVPPAMLGVSRRGYRVNVLHLTGPTDEAVVRKAYGDAGVDAQVMAFSQRMGELYARSDLAICRAGAATCAELSAFALPALLVPFPDAMRNHQMANARAMERLGAADVVEESALQPDWLAGYVEQCVTQPRRWEQMRDALHRRASGSGAEKLADVVESVGQGHELQAL
jgi:UDP-N-acetylglucosamine--N-acetylmuramyl-(pentapeptide) pyrophosphoryl-undecaprenol N-acetylglucosamine transferase